MIPVKALTNGQPLPMVSRAGKAVEGGSRRIYGLDGAAPPPAADSGAWFNNTGNYAKARFYTDITVRGTTTVLADDPTLTFRPYVRGCGCSGGGEAASYTRPRHKDLSAKIKAQFTTDVGATYTDNSAEVNDNTTGVMTLNSLDTVANGDWVVIGSTVAPFMGVALDLTNLNANAATLTVEYWRPGTGWTAVANMTDGTASGGATFGVDGQVTWDMPMPGFWGRSTINAIDAYWARFSTSAAFDAAVTLTEVDIFYPIQAVIDVQCDGDDVALFLESISSGLTGTIAYSGTVRVTWR